MQIGYLSNSYKNKKNHATHTHTAFANHLMHLEFSYAIQYYIKLSLAFDFCNVSLGMVFFIYTCYFLPVGIALYSTGERRHKRTWVKLKYNWTGGTSEIHLWEFMGKIYIIYEYILAYVSMADFGLSCWQRKLRVRTETKVESLRTLWNSLL